MILENNFDPLPSGIVTLENIIEQGPGGVMTPEIVFCPDPGGVNRGHARPRRVQTGTDPVWPQPREDLDNDVK